MPITKWNLVEICILFLFAVSLYSLYILLVEANSPNYGIENEFKPSILRGALQLALSDKGKAIRTKDFNFVGPGGITAQGILWQSNLDLEPGQLCLALGEARSNPFFSGGTKGGDESTIRYSLGISEKYFFSVLCYQANALFDKIRKNEDKSFKTDYFSNCSCLKRSQKVCCAIALGKK